MTARSKVDTWTSNTFIHPGNYFKYIVDTNVDGDICFFGVTGCLPSQGIYLFLEKSGWKVGEIFMRRAHRRKSVKL